MQPSVIHSFKGPRNIQPIVMTADQCDQYQSLAAVGINIKPGHLRQMQQMAAMDSIQGLTTTASINTPVQFLQNWLPGVVEIVTAARKIDDLIGVMTTGSWEDEEIVQTVLEPTGTAVPYGDYTQVPFANFNTNFERRTNVRFEDGFRVGRLEEARVARMRISAADSKRRGASLALEIQRNGIGFYGYNNGLGRTFGFLNDPNLPAYQSVAATGTGGATEWAQKNFLEIVGDILTAIVAVRNQSKDVIDPKKVPMTLAVATACVDYLSVTSDFGITARNWLNTNYPNIRIESAPELSGANGGENVFYLYADSVPDSGSDGGATFIQAVASKFQTIGVAQEAKGYVEDYGNATAGVMVKRPFAVVRYTGI